jgi:lysophospholipase L1-like esterase
MRALILLVLAALLVTADAIRTNPFVDPESLILTLTLALGAAGLVFSVLDRADAAALTRWRNRGFLLLFSLTLTLALGELATRIIFSEVTTTSNNRGFFNLRWARTGAVQMNGAGFRGRSFAQAKAAGTYRIAAVGDSFTYGNGIRDDERYTEIMQKQLPDRFEVLNFGSPGDNTPQHLRTIVNVVLPLKPDFVIVQWYVNDVEGNSSAGRPSYLHLLPFADLDGWLVDRSALYNVASLQWAQLQIAFGMTPTYPAYLFGRLEDPNGPDATRERDSILAIIDACRREGVPLSFVLFPDTGAPIDANSPFGYLHERLLETCREQSIRCVDLREAFAAIKDRQSLWANRLDHHPSGRANTIAAMKILETFSTDWLVSPTAVTPARQP